MAFDLLMLLTSLAIILVACAVFVNSIEWMGKALGLHQGIVGSILAAIGTALPETLIPIIAIVFVKGNAANQIGIGAILGAPFMLATLGFMVTGSAAVVFTIMGKRHTTLMVDESILRRDLLFFILFYVIAVTASLFHAFYPVKIAVSVCLLGGYVWYLRETINEEAEEIHHVEALYATRFAHLPATIPVIVAQVAVGLGMIVGAAHLFIHYVEAVSSQAGIPPLILSLIISPIATELPEKMNSIIWVGRKKDTLALGNITGAMVFQSCIPVVIGILLTDWNLHGATIVSAVIALVSALVVIVAVKIARKLNAFVLLAGGAFYLLFIIAVFGFNVR